MSVPSALGLGYSRRRFLEKCGLMVAAAAEGGCKTSTRGDEGEETLIDIHQHVGYSERTDEQLEAHQRALRVTRTILLPAGRPVDSPTTHHGLANGLQAKCAGNEACYQLAKSHPDFYAFGANEVPDLDDAVATIERYLKLGAIVIGEQKFGIECDSAQMQRLYALAADFQVPILMHWQYQMYNYGFDRFYRMLERHPRTRFIGHAQTWWAHIDRNYRDDAANLYPKGQVTPGGLTDRYLSDYPNLFGDLSAGSGLNALTRDEDHARQFLERHQDKLIFGTDCDDRLGTLPTCQGAQTIATLRRLIPSRKIQRKLFCRNAQRLFRV